MMLGPRRAAVGRELEGSFCRERGGTPERAGRLDTHCPGAASPAPGPRLGAVNRLGFHRLLHEVMMDHVGLVVGWRGQQGAAR